MNLKRWCRAVLAGGVIGWAASSSALVWVEGPADAGDLTSTAQQTVGTGPLTRISGQLDFDIDTGFFDVDLFAITIEAPSFFTALTQAAVDTLIDPVLWLFDSTGHGVYMNDDRSASDQQSTLPASHPLGPLAVGRYYLGISWTLFDPISDLANPFSSIFPIYESLLPTDGVYGPTGSGGLGALAGWTPNIVRQDLPSQYIIDIRGVRAAVPEPATVLLLLLGMVLIAVRRVPASLGAGSRAALG
jgi:hypothetical protein